MFRIGQKVVCVDDSPNPDPEIQRLVLLRPKLGEVYTVASIHKESYLVGYGIRLEELPNPSFIWGDGSDVEWSFDSSRFRPVAETGPALLREVVKL